MNRSWIHGLIGLSVTLLVLIVCFAYFSIIIATRSHPVPYKESTSLVADTVRVFRNSFGIPHVIGRNVSDVVFAQGYLHAQDRLWQMELWRRTGQGRLAEILGPKATAVDVFMRAIDIPSIAAQNIKHVDAETKSMLEAYANGVNKYLEEHREKLPMEFDALGYFPEPWSVNDCLIVGRALAFELSLAMWTDLTFGQIALQRGGEAYRSYLPHTSEGPYVLDTALGNRRRTPDTSTSPLATPDVSEHIKGLRQTIRDVRSTLGMNGSAFGSNCWAVKVSDGGSIVANDPHLSLSMPPKWYQIHLSTDNFNVLGMSIPGIPFVLSGRNDSLAWGFSNAMIDDVDYVVELVDKTNSNYYFDTDGSRKKFRYRRDTIHINGQPDSLVDLRFTTRGCVVSDVHLIKTPAIISGIKRGRGVRFLDTTCLTMQWTARYPSNEIGAIHRINRASTFSDVVDATSTWGAPSLNFSVGTINGTVGTVVAGTAPIRGYSDPNIPVSVSNPLCRWVGVTSLHSLGTLVNPRSGYVLSANNAHYPNPSVNLGSIYEPASRAFRIQELLSIYKDPSVRDVQVMQLDVNSPYALRMVKRLIPIFERSSRRLSEIERNAVLRLKQWDGTQSSIDPAASIYAALLQRLVWNLFEDELGRELYYDYLFVSNLALKRLDELIDKPEHVLWDDSRTPVRENLSWIATRSLIEALREVREHFQSDQDTSWRYGRLHTITFPHVFGANEFMKPTMNQGPFESFGSHTSINATEWNLAKPYETRVAASMRIISDMLDTVQYSVVPGGSSGQPLHSHYSDQLQLWLKGGYIRMPVRATRDVSFRLYQVFVPKVR